LYGTKVSDAGLEQLLPLKKLKKLYVWQSQVTKSGIESLGQKMPDLEITGEIEMSPPATTPDAPPPDAKMPSSEEPKSGDGDK
jgi:hypothetical protein